MAYNSERLQIPFSDIIGASSTEQKLVSLLWNMFRNTPLPDNGSSISQQAAKNIILHLLCTVNSVGLINVAGYHSSAITLLRSIEDALDCFRLLPAMKNKLKNG
ncbi:MAG: hypothetical protein IJW71_04235 [Clostridia bacterium]|nr:hypothetical protein [Clostridia bacterium]